MGESLDKLSKIIDSSEKDLTKLKDLKKLLNKEFEEYKTKILSFEDQLKATVEKDIEFNQLKAENEKLKTSVNDINTQLGKISKLYQEMSQKKEESIDVKELLSIYVVLLEEVFEGRPHAKILFLLHGDNQTLSREAVTKATGFQPATVLHSIHALNNAGLLEYNSDKDEITLTKKIY